MRWSLCGRPVSFPRRRRRWRFEPTSPRCAASLCCVPPRSSRSSLLLISPLLCFLYLLVKITRGLKFRVLLVLLELRCFSSTQRSTKYQPSFKRRRCPFYSCQTGSVRMWVQASNLKDCTAFLWNSSAESLSITNSREYHKFTIIYTLIPLFWNKKWTSNIWNKRKQKYYITLTFEDWRIWAHIILQNPLTLQTTF